MTTTFGPTFSRILKSGAAALPGGVPPEWVLAVLALESGFNPNAANPSGARGLWQKMPTNGVLYPCPAPEIQLTDAFHFWMSMSKAFRVTSFSSRAAFYCLNLAPARLKDNAYTDNTVLYAGGGKAYLQNKGLDVNHDGSITLSELDPCLSRAVARCQARYDAEVAAVKAI